MIKSWNFTEDRLPSKRRSIWLFVDHHKIGVRQIREDKGGMISTKNDTIYREITNRVRNNIADQSNSTWNFNPPPRLQHLFRVVMESNLCENARLIDPLKGFDERLDDLFQHHNNVSHCDMTDFSYRA